MRNSIFIMLFMTVSVLCEAHTNIIIDVEKTLDSLESKQLSVKQLQFHLSWIIDIDYSLKKRVDGIDTSYLSSQYSQDTDYEERHKDTLLIVKSYQTIEEIIIQEDDSLHSYFANRGINIFYPFYPMLRYKNKIFIRGHYYGFIVTLLKPKVVTVELVYLIFD